jgi:NADPH2:quinone reductase
MTALVAGGAGAVGHYAIQFARLLGGSHVFATVSNEEKAALARDSGANTVINYRTQDVVRSALDATSDAGIDRVIEVDIAADAAIDLEVIRRDGQLVVYGSGSQQFQLPFFPLIAKNVHVRFFIAYHLSVVDRDRAIALLHDWLVSGTLKHNIAARCPLGEIARAHSMVEDGRVVGNVVVSSYRPSEQCSALLRRHLPRGSAHFTAAFKAPHGVTPSAAWLAAERGVATPERTVPAWHQP